MIAYILITILGGIFFIHMASAYTLDEKNTILDEFVKTDKPIESVFDKCRIHFDAVKNNDTKLADSCMDFVSRYNIHMKELVNETRNDMIEILVDN